MIVGLGALLAGNAAALLGARLLLRRCRTGSGSTDALLFVLIRLALLSIAVLLAGLTRTLTAPALGIASLLALAGLLAAGAHRGLRLPARIGPAGWLALAVLARLLLQVWFFAPHLGDATAYHLPKIAEWIRAGGFTREMGVHPHVSFPAGFELVETWWAVFLRHDVLIEMAGVEFVLLAFAATRAMAERLGLDARAAFFAGLLFALVPGFHLSATSCMNDAPAAALVVALAALLAARAPLPLLLLTAGLGVGVKPTFGFALPGMLLLAWLWRREPKAATSIPRPLAWGLAAAGLLLGSFWYARNIAWYGNPFHPLGTPGFENPVAVQLGPSAGSFLRNAADLMNLRIYDDQAAQGANVDYIAGWGAPAFACGLIALLLGMREDARLRRLAAAFGVSLATSLLFIQNDPWCLKYVFYFPALLAVATARLAALSRPFGTIAACALGFSFLGTMLPYDLPAKDFGTLARQGWRERSALALTGDAVSGDSVGCFAGHSGTAYLLYGPDFSRRVVYLRPVDDRDLVERMRRAGIRLLYAAPASASQVQIVEEAVRDGRLKALGGHVYGLP